MQSPHGVKFSGFRPSVMGRNGMVTSGYPLASQAGVQTMMAGGNAIDAAVATAAALGTETLRIPFTVLVLAAMDLS